MQVHDGYAEQTLEVRSDWSYLVLKFQIANIMNMAPDRINLAYKAPWCRKPGEGLVPRYINNDDDYQAMFRRSQEHIAGQGKKGKGNAATNFCDISLIHIEKGEVSYTMRMRCFD